MRTEKILLCLSMVVFITFGGALTLKAAIGVGAWDALAQTGSVLTGIRVGTVGMLFNFLCILIELAVLKKDFKLKHAMQIVLCLFIGYAVNFFYYTVLGGVEFSNYFLRVAVLILGHIISAFTIAVIMLLNVVTFALEGACKAVSDKTGIRFHVLRQGLDIVCIVASAALSFLFHVPLAVREGTLIGMLIFGPILGLFMKILKPVFQRYHLTDAVDSEERRAGSER